MGMVTMGGGARRYVVPRVTRRTASKRLSHSAHTSPFRPIAEAEFDLKLSRRQVRLQIYAPRRRRDASAWTCAYAIQHPIGVRSVGVGETSMQALFGALRGLSRALYGSAQFKTGRLARLQESSRDLIVPVTSDLLDVTPVPF